MLFSKIHPNEYQKALSMLQTLENEVLRFTAYKMKMDYVATAQKLLRDSSINPSTAGSSRSTSSPDENGFIVEAISSADEITITNKLAELRTNRNRYKALFDSVKESGELLIEPIKKRQGRMNEEISFDALPAETLMDLFSKDLFSKENAAYEKALAELMAFEGKETADAYSSGFSEQNLNAEFSALSEEIRNKIEEIKDEIGKQIESLPLADSLKQDIRFFLNRLNEEQDVFALERMQALNWILSHLQTDTYGTDIESRVKQLYQLPVGLSVEWVDSIKRIAETELKYPKALTRAAKAASVLSILLSPVVIVVSALVIAPLLPNVGLAILVGISSALLLFLTSIAIDIFVTQRLRNAYDDVKNKQEIAQELCQNDEFKVAEQQEKERFWSPNDTFFENKESKPLAKKCSETLPTRFVGLFFNDKDSQKLQSSREHFVEEGKLVEKIVSGLQQPHDKWEDEQVNFFFP